jgi:hypothetical protein
VKRSVEVPFILIVSLLTVWGTASLIRDAHGGPSDVVSRWMQDRFRAVVKWFELHNAQATSSHDSGMVFVKPDSLDKQEKLYSK